MGSRWAAVLQSYLKQVGDSSFMLKQHEGGHGISLFSNVLLDQGQHIGLPHLKQYDAARVTVSLQQ